MHSATLSAFVNKTCYVCEQNSWGQKVKVHRGLQYVMDQIDGFIMTVCLIFMLISNVDMNGIVFVLSCDFDTKSPAPAVFCPVLMLLSVHCDTPKHKICKYVCFLPERALYSFECAFHPLFSLTSGRSRLDYLRPENRFVVSVSSYISTQGDPWCVLWHIWRNKNFNNSLVSARRAFYLAIYKHMMFLEKRGCPRTALEYCKLILRYEGKQTPITSGFKMKRPFKASFKKNISQS